MSPAGGAYYRSFFEHCRSETKIGQVTPAYFDHPIAVERIKAAYPNVKLIAGLRDPCERAFSSRTGYIQDASFPKGTSLSEVGD